MAVVAALSLVFVAACGDDADSTSGSSDSPETTVSQDVLGTPNPATGEAVKVGFVSDGRTASVDNSQMEPAAKATVEYINEYLGGIAGRPIDLVTCATAGEPGKATDCANQFVQEGVALVLMPETQQPVAVHSVTAANNIPLFVYAATDPALTQDANATFMIGSLGGALSGLPIAVAQENDLKTVNAIVVDVPAATSYYEPGSAGAAIFEDAGIDLNLIKVPLGAADLSQQINEIVSGDPSVALVIGDPAVCISAFNGLVTNGFEGKITTVPTCTAESVVTAVGANIEGVAYSTNTPLGDDSNTGIQLFNAILAKYAPDYPDSTLGLSSFITTYSAIQALTGIDAASIDPATVLTTIKGMDQLPLVTGAGLGFRCNGKADPTNPAVCMRGTLKVTLDAEGKPVLPYVAVGTDPIPA